VQSGPKTMRPRVRRSAFGVRPKFSTVRPTHPSPHSAQRNYEQYLALARTLNGGLGLTFHSAAIRTMEHYARKVRANSRRLSKG
jgi:hypothetical protein